ncbi:PucR family transcriptional regulator [Actinomadura rugatobispora]|uniref:PucR family transcriptional regulator n=1 Tax=Actinomadura rugatobispora TaxID=1994 RepID=A0ABW1AHI3_9ACTN|nr:PucR family transcriptional regulator [Actinomadura rugatobispora]
MAQATMIPLPLPDDRPPARRGAAPPPDVVAVLRPELPSLAAEIVEEIRYSVTEFGGPLQDGPPTVIRPAVERALRQFVDRLADPAAAADGGTRICRGFGRHEYRAGRSLDALQAAYRVGARVAWRRIADVGRRAGWPAETMSLLAEAVFTYVEEIAAYTVEGHLQARQSASDRLQALRRRLVELVLTRGHAMSGEALADLAREARWRLPATVACVAVAERPPDGRLAPAVGPDVLVDLQRPDPCLIVPDPDAPGREDMLARALRGTEFAIGPSVPLDDAALSLRLAVQALSLVQRGVVGCDRYVRCSDELSTLLLFHNEDVIQLMTRRRYGPLAALKPLQQVRLGETLLTWLVTGGKAPEMAARLHVHAQTVRYRMRQLQDLFGAEMEDADWRFEMEIILRTRLLRDDRSRQSLRRAGEGTGTLA